jgi:uncharacterized protein (TIGR00303 family)
VRLVLVAGTTATAEIEGISAAGSTPALTYHTPSADSDILVYGRPVVAPDGTNHPTPISPTGCPTPAVITRAAREVLGFDVTVLDAGLSTPTGAPTVDLKTQPEGGGDIRDPEPVPDAPSIFERARSIGSSLPGPLLVGETIPGGTTTALGVLRALGHSFSISSSFADNPQELKQRVVRDGLDASGLTSGDAADDPLLAVRTMGDPVLAAVTGLTVGALDAGTEITLAGGTQLLTAGALVRAFSSKPLSLATTSFVADSVSDLSDAADTFDLNLAVTDPGFTDTHVAMERYLAGEAKEGVGMGGVLAAADGRTEGTNRMNSAGTNQPETTDSNQPETTRTNQLDAVRERIKIVYDRLLTDHET